MTDLEQAKLDIGQTRKDVELAKDEYSLAESNLFAAKHAYNESKKLIDEQSNAEPSVETYGIINTNKEDKTHELIIERVLELEERVEQLENAFAVLQKQTGQKYTFI